MRWACIGVIILCCGLSCKPDDPCDSIQCQHGTCAEGACICETYYEGENCETESRTKFLGTNWYNSRTCAMNSLLMVSKIQATATHAGAISITNLHVSPDTVFAEVKGDTLTLPMQVHGFEYIRGMGFYSDNSITLEYTVIETGGDETNCIAHLSR